MEQWMIQGTPEWHALRKTKITATDAPVIMGVSPWVTPYQLFKLKTGLSEPQPENENMRRGKELEPVARDSFNKETGLKMAPAVVFHPTEKWIMASLDGIDTEKCLIVEIKCPGAAIHSVAEQGEIPDYYYPQIQHQLFACGEQFKMAYYYSFFDRGISVMCPRDDEYIAKMFQEEKKFYNCLMNFEPPPMTAKDFTVREDIEWATTALEWRAARHSLEVAEAREKECKQKIIALGNNMSCIGHGIKLSKIVRKGNVEYANIPELKRLDLEQYRRPNSEFWTVREG